MGWVVAASCLALGVGGTARVNHVDERVGVAQRLADLGDPWADLQAAPGRIDTLLGWWQRDLDAGLGELPFPPEFPKMPGEPPRVQPSRARSTD